MTYTYAEIEVSAEAYDEIAEKLRAAGYDHAFNEGAIDMHGIGLTRGEPDEPAPAYLTPEELAALQLQKTGHFRAMFDAASDELVRKTYGDTVSYDAETGEQVETPPELKAQIDAALEDSLEATGTAVLAKFQPTILDALGPVVTVKQIEEWHDREIKRIDDLFRKALAVLAGTKP